MGRVENASGSAASLQWRSTSSRIAGSDGRKEATPHRPAPSTAEPPVRGANPSQRRAASNGALDRREWTRPPRGGTTDSTSLQVASSRPQASCCHTASIIDSHLPLRSPISRLVTLSYPQPHRWAATQALQASRERTRPLSRARMGSPTALATWLTIRCARAFLPPKRIMPTRLHR